MFSQSREPNHIPQLTNEVVPLVNTTENKSIQILGNAGDADRQAATTAFMNHGENTMSASTSASISSLLIRLAKRYLDFTISKEGEFHLNEEKLNTYFDNLKKEIQEKIQAEFVSLDSVEMAQNSSMMQCNEHEEKNEDQRKKLDYSFLQSAWDYLQNRMSEEPDTLDQVIFFENGKKWNCIIDIKTTLVLVYAAISDSDIFKLDAKNAASYRRDRLWSLFATFKRLQFDSKQRCHQGIRHDLVVCNLAGVYPDAMIVAEPKNFLANLISEYISKLLEIIRSECGQTIYLEVMQACLMREVHPELAKYLGDRREIQAAIEHQFRDVGLDPDDKQYEISKYINALKVVVTLPEDLIKIGNQVYALLNAEPDEKNVNRDQFILFMKQTWLKTQFSLASPEQHDRIQVLSEVEAFYALYQKTHTLPSVFEGNAKLSIESLNAVFKKVDTYYQTCLSKQEPIVMDQAFLAEIASVGAVLRKLEMDFDWVQNIFPKWNVMMEEYGTHLDQSLPNELIKLHQDIFNPMIQAHYLINDDSLKRIFKGDVSGTEAIVKIDYYNMNRIFLSAIATPVQKWTPLFFTCLNVTIQFVNQGFHADDLSANSQNLKKHSYPEKLLKQLFYLTQQYQKINLSSYQTVGDPSKLSEDDQIHGMYIPALHQVSGFASAVRYYGFLPESERESFFQYLKDHQICQLDDPFIIKHEWKAFEEISLRRNLATNMLSVLLNIHSSYARVGFSNLNFLIQRFIGLLEPDQRMLLLKHLGLEYMQSVFSNESNDNKVESFCNLFKSNIKEIFDWLGMDFIKKWLMHSPEDSFLHLISCCSENEKIEVLDYMGSSYLTSLDSNSLRSIFYLLSDDQKIFFIEKRIGLDRFRTCLNDFSEEDQLFNIFECQALENRLAMLNWIGFDFIKNLINNNFDKIISLVSRFSPEDKEKILKQLGVEYIQNAFFKNPNMDFFMPKLKKFFGLDEYDKLNLMDVSAKFGAGFIKKFFSECEQYLFVRLVKEFPDNQIEAIINSMDLDDVNSFQINSIIEIFKKFPRDQRMSFLLRDAWRDVICGGVYRQSIRPKIFDALQEEERFYFYEWLGYDFLRGVIHDQCYQNPYLLIFAKLPEDKHLLILKGLGSDFLKESLSDLNNSSEEDQLFNIFECHALENRLAMLNWIGFDFIKNLINSNFDKIISLISRFSPDDKEKILKQLGVEYIQNAFFKNLNMDFAIPKLKKFFGLNEKGKLNPIDVSAKFGSGFIKKFFSECEQDQFVRLIKEFPENQIGEIINSMDPDEISRFERPVILEILQNLPRDQRMSFLLRDAWRNMICEMYDPSVHSKIFDAFQGVERFHFHEWLGYDFLRQFFRGNRYPNVCLIVVLGGLPKDKRLLILKGLGSDFLKESLLRGRLNPFDLIYLFPQFEHQLQVFKLIGLNTLQQLMRESTNLQKFIKYIPEDKRLDFLQLLGSEFLRAMISESLEAMFLLTDKLPVLHQLHFLQRLDFDFLRYNIMISPEFPFKKLMGSIAQAERLTLLQSLGLDFFKKMPIDKMNHILQCCLPLLESHEKLIFIEWLGVDFLQRLAQGYPGGMSNWLFSIKTCADDNQLLRQILVLLGNRFIKSEIRRSDEIEWFSSSIGFNIPDLDFDAAVSTSSLGVFKSPLIKTARFIFYETFLGLKQSSFPQAVKGITTSVQRDDTSYFPGVFLDWIKLLDEWSTSEALKRPQHQWFAAYDAEVLAGLILIRYPQGDFGLVLGAKTGCEEALSVALQACQIKSTHYKPFSKMPFPPLYLRGPLHEIYQQLPHVLKVMKSLEIEGERSIDQLMEAIKLQLDHVKDLPQASFEKRIC